MWITPSWAYLEVMHKKGKVIPKMPEVVHNSGAFWGEKSG